MTTPGLHLPNPLDRLFFAIDDAWRRCGLPGVDIWIHVECVGRIDIDGMRAALRALWRLYPATCSRLERSGWSGAPRWRLEAPAGEPELVVLTCATAKESQARVEEEFATRIDWADRPPMRLYVLHEQSGDDRVLVRWPHAFADARGGVTLIEELARLYDERPELATLASAGDELRRDAGILERETGGQVSRAVRRARPTEIRWTSAPPQVGREKVALELRRLNGDQTAAVRAAALRVCGVARLSDYLRASAICALHKILDEPGGAGQAYSTVQLIDNRRKRDRGPVCHNLFSALPIFVPCEQAGDRRAVADVIQQAAAEALASGQMQRTWRRLKQVSLVPTALLARLLARSLRGGRRWLPLGLANAPTLPLGFMGPLATPRTTFCGAGLRNILGVRPPSVQAGFAINVNTAQERINIAASFFEPRIERTAMARYLDRYVELLLDGRSAG
jgi:hypothetical protein